MFRRRPGCILRAEISEHVQPIPPDHAPHHGVGPDLVGFAQAQDGVDSVLAQHLGDDLRHRHVAEDTVVIAAQNGSTATIDVRAFAQRRD